MPFIGGPNTPKTPVSLCTVCREIRQYREAGIHSDSLESQYGAVLNDAMAAAAKRIFPFG
jgi:hypothetical protein